MIPNLLPVDSGIWRGGQPDDDGWNYLNTLGIKTVVKLNTDKENSDVAAAALGMELVYCPIDLDDQILFRPHRHYVKQAVEAMAAKQPIFVHCEHGQDRTGLIVGCYRVWKQNWAKGNAWDEMIKNGFHWELLGLTLFWEFGV